MPTPVPRTPVRIARGTKANLDTALGLGDILEGELCYAKDEDKTYMVEGGVFVAVGGASSLADLNDVDLTTTPPANNNVLKYDGVNWVPAEGGGTGTGSIRGDGGNFTTGLVGFDFATGVYGGGNFTTPSIDTPIELEGAMDGGSF